MKLALLLLFLAVSFEVAHARDVIRGDGGRLRALQEEFSVPGDLSFAGVKIASGGDGLGSKSPKSPMMSSKAGKGKKVECSFANPIVEQVQYMNERLDQFVALQKLLDHAEAINEGFVKPIVEKRIEGNISDEEIIEKGSSVSEGHDYYLTVFIISALGVETSVKYLCSVYNSLWKQMIGTCNYDDWKEDYKSVAALLMDGFVDGLSSDIEIDFLTCTELPISPP
jgi:hypothetical protein